MHSVYIKFHLALEHYLYLQDISNLGGPKEIY